MSRSICHSIIFSSKFVEPVEGKLSKQTVSSIKIIPDTITFHNYKCGQTYKASNYKQIPVYRTISFIIFHHYFFTATSKIIEYWIKFGIVFIQNNSKIQLYPR